MRVLLLVQQKAFDGVFDKRLKTLLPFTNKDGVIRIKTKVSNRADVNDSCYPIVSCNHEHLVVFRLILDWHRDNSHVEEVKEIGVPDANLIESSHLNRRLRYRQHLKSTLRERFSTEYLGQLKLFSAKGSPKELSVGEIVLIGNDDSKRIDWPLARITMHQRKRRSLYPLELELRSDEVSQAAGGRLLESVEEDVALVFFPGTPDPDEGEEEPVKSSEVHEQNK
ncbi:hypothetical protein ILUMI_26791 [Ignelater luminosus]|uniref:DUF5641 domain-containing protein n=1 Tax=Ignelater luminosus TaxID=2038154 RepID=A0A8K0C7D9_IGNLU|nr:hypothetical protein ILUMI_26791 [Ignelater luminosus]